MAAYPVRGLDINSSSLIYNLLTKQKDSGVAVIFVGEDLDVLLELCDKILVLCGGQVNGYLDARTTTKEEVGMCAILKNNIDNVYLNSFCFGFRLKDKILINNEFLCYLLLSQKYRKIISNLGQGFTRVNISKNQLLDIDVEIPSINTQNRISNTISSLENHINLEFEKLSKLNELKKGLMQNMFV